MAVSQNDEKTTEPPSSTLNSDSFKPNGEHVNQSNEISTNGDIGKSNELSANGDSEDKASNNAEDQAVPSFTLKPIEIEEIFKADYLQQLSTSALPRYIPGSPPRFIKTDIKAFDIHCCAACGDTFALKASLNFHLDRRSVLIKFPCEACKTTRIFYNRCNLLSHVRAHTDKNEKAEIEKAALSVLPRVFMDGIHNEFVSTLDDELTSMDDTDDPRPGEMVECSLRELDETELDKENDENEEKDISFAKVKCLDCNEEFDSPKARREHLTNGDKIPVIVSQCNKCGLLCPSKCSLKAHQRIHLQISPYVCPECGESPDPVWANFLHHVHYACFHNSRGVGYKCPICKRFTPSNDLLLKHMELHTEKYAKCSECPRAYNSADAFKQHNNMFHEGGQVRYTMIYKCSLCDIVFVSSDQMLTHRSAHLKDQVCEYVFNCMQCGKPLESKSQLLDHLKSHHPKIYNQHIQTGPIPTKSVAASNQYRGTVECIICSATFYSQQGYNVHLYRAHINVNKPCCYCSEVMCNRQKMVAHGKAHLEDKAVVCLLCNNMRFSSLKELDAHLDNHVRKLKFCSFCPICDKLFLNLNASLNHLRVEHYLPVKKIPPSEETENNLASSHSKVNICHLCRKSFGSTSDLQVHFRQTHNVGSLDGTFEQPAAKKPRVEGNGCAKCDFRSANREEFKKHILSHKTNRSTFQCQECGLCFVVQPSLSKHLRIVHKISDTTKYISDEGTNYMPELENPSEKAKLNALECSVCFTSFPNETALKTHMRSHGMAFIQANKTDRSSGPIIKKAETGTTSHGPSCIVIL